MSRAFWGVFWLLFFSIKVYAFSVVVSIKPLHSLVQGVMGNQGKASLIVKNQSPHTFHLKPSQRIMLSKAKVVFFSGASDSFMIPLKDALSSRVLFVALGDDDEHPKKEHPWLNPMKAKKMVKKIQETLIKIDPQNESIYRQNAKTLNQKLNSLDERLKKRFKRLENKPILVFHDAYDELIFRYHLKVAGFVLKNPRALPSLKQIQNLKIQLKKTPIACAMKEPEFSPKLLELILEGSDIRVGSLDPLGSFLEPGAQLYFQLMDQISLHLIETCLKEPTPS